MGRAEPWPWALSTPPNWLLRELRPGEGATCPTARPRRAGRGEGRGWRAGALTAASGAGGRGSLFGGSAPADELTPACCPACPSRALPTGAGCLASPGPLPAALGDPTLPMGTTAEGAGSATLSTGRLAPAPHSRQELCGSVGERRGLGEGETVGHAHPEAKCSCMADFTREQPCPPRGGGVTDGL